MTSDLIETERRDVAARGGETRRWACRPSGTVTITQEQNIVV